MKQLFMKQKVFSLGESFTIQDRSGEDVYFVEGSFLKIPKNFTVYDEHSRPITRVTKKMLSLMPKIFVEVDQKETFTIEKRIAGLKPKYIIEGDGLSIEGDWWDLNFDIMKGYRKVAKVRRRWVSRGESYELTIFEDDNEHALVGLIAAIDFVKYQEQVPAPSNM